VDIPIHGDTLGLNLSAYRYGQSTVLLKWNNPSAMENKLKKYLIYVNGKAINDYLRYDPTSTEMEYIFDEYECGQPFSFFVEGIFSSKENRAPLRSNEITFMEGPLNDKLVLDCLPIYSTMRDWVFEAGYFEDNGVDFSAAQNMPCQAVFDGTVIESKDYDDGFLKNMVFIAPKHRYSYRGHPIDCVWYSHMNARCVKKGDSVKAGDVIGLSGIANKSPHLHFGICRAHPDINWETEGMLRSKRCYEDYDNELVSEILGVWYNKHIIGNCNGIIPEKCEKVPKDQELSIRISRDRL
jgi:hypothetical protein